MYDWEMNSHDLPLHEVIQRAHEDLVDMVSPDDLRLPDGERLTSATLGSMNVAWPTRRELRGVRFYNLGTPSQQRLTDRMWLVE